MGTVLLMIFPSQFKFKGNFVSPLFHFWPLYRYKLLHMTQQHICRVMCKILQPSLCFNGWQQNKILIEFELQWKNHQWSEPDAKKDVFTLFSEGTHCNTLRPEQNGRHFAYDNFKSIFWKKRICIFIQILLNVVLKGPIHLIHKSQNAPDPYPTMLHSEQKCAHFCSEWNIVGYGTDAFWDLWKYIIEN